MILNLFNLAPFALSEAAEAGATKAWFIYSALCSLTEDQTIRSIIMIALVILCIASGYVIGSINPAIIFSKKIYHDDIRSHGSGNAGTTNMLRTYGKKMAALIFILDFLKAALAVGIGTLLLSVNVGGAISALFVVLGHMFPVFYGFKGGKGVACTAACIMLLSPFTFIIILPIFILIVLFTKYISLASIMSALLFPLLAYSFRGTWGSDGGFITISALFIGGFVVFMHRENMKRLLEGKENKIALGKKKNADVEKQSNENKKIEIPQKEYSDDDFYKCSCGRLVPKSRRECVYCGEKNPHFIPPQKESKKKK